MVRYVKPTQTHPNPKNAAKDEPMAGCVTDMLRPACHKACNGLLIIIGSEANSFRGVNLCNRCTRTLFTLACILRQCFSGVVPSNTRACSILLVCIANVWSCQASPPDISDKRKFPFGPGAIDAEVASCPSMEGTPLGEFCQGTNLCYDQRRMGL